MPLICAVCFSDKGVILKFSDSTLSKFRECLSVRKQRNFKYHNALEPQTKDEVGYHSACYKKFTAIPKQPVPEPVPVPGTSQSGITRSSQGSACITTSSTGVFEKICLFCRKSRKKINNTYHKLTACETKDFEHKLKEQATRSNDFEMLTLIALDDFVAKEVMYHSVCRLRYFKKCSIESKVANPIKTAHEQASFILRDFVNDYIINQNKAMFLTELLIIYKDAYVNCMDLNKEDCASFTYTTQHLEVKLKKEFPSEIKFSKLHNKIVVFSSNTSEELLPTIVSSTVNSLTTAALQLRNEIMNANVHPLGERITVNDISVGEIEIPEALTSFLTCLIGGTDPRRQKGNTTARVVQSIAQDILFAARHRRFMPPKQLKLGLAIKSLSNSRRVINILNRFGHTASYSYLEEVETSLCDVSDKFIPSDLILAHPELNVSVGWDNFDRFVDTFSGKDTLHDTQGICWHNVSNACSEETSCIPSTSKELIPLGSQRQRKRALEQRHEILVPYNKKPKMIPGGILSDCDNFPQSLRYAELYDLLWMLSVNMKIDNTPMWVGYNSLTLIDSTPQQRIFYLPSINESPTSNTVVYETMKRSVSLANECGQKHITVTYDLAIAKMAYCIQNEEECFKDIFIRIGEFHLVMAFFKSVGKFIDECGLTHILVELNLLGSGSVNGFIGAKHYSRCKRLHQYLFVALQGLQFNWFLEKTGKEIPESCSNDLQTLLQSKFKLETLNISHDLELILEQYKVFNEECLQGEHGKTPQFYSIYLQFMKYYLNLQRAIRTSDFDLYVHTYPKFINLFFTFNQPNYARWTVHFYNQLLNIDETHPGLREYFNNGGLGVKRTSNDFARIPGDLTLEQTVNADAARRLASNPQFSNSASGREKWARNHSARTEIISLVNYECGIRKPEDCIADLMPNKIEKNIKAVEKIKSAIQDDYINPFSSDLDPSKLYNIVTGKALQDQTTDFLTNAEKIGHSQRQKFKDETNERPQRFNEAIKQNKILNFASENVKRIQVKNKIIPVKTDKNLFARLLGISLENQISLDHVLSFPLTPIPSALCHPDGSFHKTQKSTLFRYLERKIDSDSPKAVDVLIVDGFYFLRTMTSFPRTFGQLAKKVMTLISFYKTKNVHLIFDRYFSPSLKDSERNSRYSDSTSYKITSPEQTLPSNFAKALNNVTLKEEIVSFLLHFLKTNEMVPFFPPFFKLYLTHQEKCFVYEQDLNNQLIMCDEIIYLTCDHEEADTRIVFHLSRLENCRNILIKSNDTDVLLILLSNMDHLPSCIENIWMEIGLATLNSSRHINVSSLFKKIGTEMAKGLVSFHIFTGCDYTPAFFKKGKVNPLKIIEKNQRFWKPFIDIANRTSSGSTFKELEEFTCRMYGLNQCNSVNEGRLTLFTKSYKPKRLEEKFLLKHFPTFSSSTIPPSDRELKEQIKRTIFLGKLLSNSHENFNNACPNGNGWAEIDSKYVPTWFEGDMAPSTIFDCCGNRTLMDEDDENLEENLTVEEVNSEDDSEEEEED